ncbi:hypothetical protein VTO42DRAFT_1950 [Malbranchea cinnamomea]
MRVKRPMRGLTPVEKAIKIRQRIDRQVAMHLQSLETERQRGLERQREERRTLQVDIMASKWLRLARRFRSARRRVLDEVVRDHMVPVTRADRQEFGRQWSPGTVTVADADCVADARLSSVGRERFLLFYLRVYGIKHEQVLRLAKVNDEKSIRLIDTFSTARLREWRARRELPRSLVAAYDRFIAHVPLYVGRDVADASTVIGEAYHAFWAEMNRFSKPKKKEET